MKKGLTSAVAALMMLSASTAFAGGPIIIEEEMEVVPEKAGSSVGILPIIIVTVALCAALCGGSGEEDPR